MNVSPVRQVTAICRFTGGPGREQEAAEAWAFELTHYFLRGVGEAPKVTYADGVYTCTGLMQTTYPLDTDPTIFDASAPPWDLDFCVNRERREGLLAMMKGRPRFDGR